jgi:hypothetical protein
MSHFPIIAGPCRPGITGATRPGSDFSYDIRFLILNSSEPEASAFWVRKTSGRITVFAHPGLYDRIPKIDNMMQD